MSGLAEGRCSWDSGSDNQRFLTQPRSLTAVAIGSIIWIPHCCGPDASIVPSSSPTPITTAAWPSLHPGNRGIPSSLSASQVARHGQAQAKRLAAPRPRASSACVGPHPRPRVRRTGIAKHQPKRRGANNSPGPAACELGGQPGRRRRHLEKLGRAQVAAALASLRQA
jgi:hypothetical protein